MTMGQHDFTNTMAGAGFMSMSRRCRHDAKLRHSEHQKPSQEATKRDHADSLKYVCYRLLNHISAAPVWMITATRKPNLLIVRP
jgi:hypothetical protein